MHRIGKELVDEGAIFSDPLDRRMTLALMIDDVDYLYTKVERPREAAAVMALDVQIAEHGLLMAERASGKARCRMPTDFIKALRASHGTEDAAMFAGAPLPAACLDWAAVGVSAAACAERGAAPGAATMLGPLGAGARARRTYQRRQRAEEGERVTAKDIDLGAKEKEKQETDALAQEMLQQLQAQSRAGLPLVPFTTLVCNHRSFGQTLENIFALSFLLKGGHVALQPSGDPEGGMAVRFLGVGEALNAAKAGAKQVCLALTMDSWEIMCAVAARRPEGRRCLMPHRAPQQH